MGQYYLCITLIVFLFLLFIHEITQDLKKIDGFSKRIVLCLFLTLLFKYDYGVHFYGLEYEDAYVFSFCARQFLYGVFPISFLIDAVSVGSLTEPVFTSVYGGHFIMYPVYLTLITNIFGWSPTTISIANTMISFFIMLILSVLPRNQRCWFVLPILYCCAPVINLFTTCFLSEIFSSFICLIFVYTYYRKRSMFNYILCLISFFVAIMCKRENLVLLIVPFLDFFYQPYCLNRKNDSLFRKLKYIPFALIICVYFLFIQNVFEIENVESVDIKNPTFSIQYFSVLFPVFIKSLLTVKSFSIVFVASVVWFIYVYVYKRQYRLMIIAPFILFGVYLVLYSFHYRGYFFVRDKFASTFETYRYINNFFYLLPVLFLLFKCKYIKQVKFVLCILLVFSFYNTCYIRNEMSNIEYQERFKEAEQVSNYIQTHSVDAILICENILIYQNICDEEFKICDIRLSDVLEKDKGIERFILFSDIDYLQKRYSLSIDLDNLCPVLKLESGRYLYKYRDECEK